jgi:hypothetical protein
VCFVPFSPCTLSLSSCCRLSRQEPVHRHTGARVCFTSRPARLHLLHGDTRSSSHIPDACRGEEGKEFEDAGIPRQGEAGGGGGGDDESEHRPPPPQMPSSLLQFASRALQKCIIVTCRPRPTRPLLPFARPFLFLIHPLGGTLSYTIATVFRVKHV